MPTKDFSEIGRYLVERRLGHGAMGEVYLAKDQRLHRQVAIKILRLAALSSEEERNIACRLFLKEARITGNLNHGHITIVHDMGIHQGLPYLVMEYIDGRNLREIMTDGGPRLTSKDKLTTLALLAHALHYAHQRQVLHRDIKPANIMIAKNGTPKITDFGIASFLGLAEGRPQAGGDERLLVGTPHYMSPEHIRGCGFDARSDVFSLGIVAYEWLSGQKPFTGASMEEIMRQVLTAAPAPLSRISPLDERLDGIVQRALAKDREERYQSAEEFSDALELYLNSQEEADTEVVAGYFAQNRGDILTRLKRRYVFFADFTDDELLSIFRLSHKKCYEPGEYIIREGTVGSKMYVILSGSVSVQTEANGREVEIDRLEPGSCVGEMALVDRMPRSASVVALGTTVALAINDTVLRHSNPNLCLKLYRNLAAMLSERLRGNEQRYRELLRGGQM